MAKSKKQPVDVYQKVTDTFIAALEEGTIPWHKPWTTSDGELPRNLITKKPYQGINVFLLAMTPYGSPYWLTFKQARELAYRKWAKGAGIKIDDADIAALATKVKNTENVEAFFKAGGGGVKKGEKSTMIVFWNMIKNRSYDPDEKGSRRVIPFLKYHNVFNVEQTEGVEYPKPEPVESEFTPIETCERIIAGFDGPKVTVSNRAAYAPLIDTMMMPPKEDFDTPEDYYATYFHEGVHSTGHQSRLNRPELTKAVNFGNEEYSKEELVAEMGAAMLCNVAGIDQAVIENQKAYIKGWLKKLKEDKKLLVSAAGKAQKAAYFIQGITPEPVEAN